MSVAANRASVVQGLLPVTALLLLSACASSPDAPPPELAAARTAVEGAPPEVVSRYAPLEMREARERLDLAEAAWRKERFEESRRAAAESLSSVRLARARADAAQAEEARDDVARTLQTLESEVGLSGGAATGAPTGVVPPGRATTPPSTVTPSTLPPTMPTTPAPGTR